MSLVPSLLHAIIRVDGEALVMHVGEKPYVVSPNGQVDLATRGLTFEAVNGLVAQLLPAHAMKSLEEVGATQFDLPSLDEFPGEHFTVTAARGGDDVWAEIRRRQVPDEDLVPSDIFTGLPVAASPAEAADTDDLVLPKEDQLWPGRSEPLARVGAARLDDDDLDLTPARMESPAAESSFAPLRLVEPAVEKPAAFEVAEPGPAVEEPATIEVAEIAAGVEQTAAVEVAETPAAIDEPAHAVAVVPEAAAAVVEEIPVASVFEPQEAVASALEPVIAPGVGVPRAVPPEVDSAPVAAEVSAVVAEAPVAFEEGDAALVAGPVDAGVREWPIVEAAPNEPSATAIAEAGAAETASAETASAETASAETASAETASAETASAETETLGAAAPVETFVAAPPVAAPLATVPIPTFDVHAIEPPSPVRSWLESRSPADVWSRPELWSSRLAAAAPLGEAPRTPDAPAPDATPTTPVPKDAHSLAEPEVSAVEPSEPHVAVQEAEPLSEPVMSTLPPTASSSSHIAPVAEPPANAQTPPATSLFGAGAQEPPLGTLEAGTPGAAFVPFPSLSMLSQPAVVLPIGRGGREMSTTHADQGNAALERLLRLAASRGAGAVYLSSNARPSARLDGDIQVLEGTAVLSPDEIEAMLLGVLPDRSGDALRAGASSEWVWDLAEVGRVRCASYRDHRGPGAVFRLVSVRPVSASQLGLSREIQAMASEPDGLILVSGPRSNGKSTLISSFVDLINRTRRDYVITIENEINVVHDRQGAFISQREVRGGTDEMIAAARAALREDPDILILEDLRTSALMTVALDAAAAGQLVIGGVPAHHAAGAIGRLIDLYQPEHRRQVQLSLAQNLRGVVNQVLLRKSGGGRVAAREVLLNTPLVSSLLAEGRTEQLPVAIEGGRKSGMVPLNDALVGFVQSGAVEVREAYRRAADRAGLLDLLKRQGIDTSFVERLA
jgi:twitching motility protein PilT